MIAKMTDELREAMRQQPGRPLAIKDDQTNIDYLLLTKEQFWRLIYDDRELTAQEMYAAAATALDDPDGWAAPGMDAYDDRDPKLPNP